MNIEFIDVDFKLNGDLLTSFDIISITAINITFEHDYSYWGFWVLSICNFPEAPVIGEILFKNNTVFLRNEYMNDALPESYIFYAGPFNITFDEINVSMYYGGDPWFDTILFLNEGNCRPLDETNQIIKLANTYLTSPLKSHEFKYVLSISLIADDFGVSRPYIF